MEFAQIFAHGNRDSISDQSHDHDGERHDESIPSVILGSEKASGSGMDDVTGDAEKYFGESHPNEGFC